MAKNKISGKAFAFHLDMSDLYKELGIFTKALGKDLAKEMETKNVGDKILKNTENNLLESMPKGSGRIQRLISTMKSKQKYTFKTVPGGGRKGGGSSPRLALVQLVNIKEMDKKTLIARLDRDFPPKHNAPFAGNPLKRIGSPTKNNPRNSLWRILEHVTKTRYPIAARSAKFLYYTKASDGFSKWHITKRTTWYGTNKGAFSAYYLLDSQRQVYKEDRKIFENEFKKGVKKVIQTKTRFR